jgi:hypothetical protein
MPLLRVALTKKLVSGITETSKPEVLKQEQEFAA